MPSAREGRGGQRHVAVDAGGGRTDARLALRRVRQGSEDPGRGSEDSGYDRVPMPAWTLVRRVIDRGAKSPATVPAGLRPRRGWRAGPTAEEGWKDADRVDQRPRRRP